MLSLNMGLAGLSEITRMSEIRRLYPNCSTSITNQPTNSESAEETDLFNS